MWQDLKEANPVWYNCYNEIENIIDIKTVALILPLGESPPTIIASVKLKTPHRLDLTSKRK